MVGQLLDHLQALPRRDAGTIHVLRDIHPERPRRLDQLDDIERKATRLFDLDRPARKRRTDLPHGVQYQVGSHGLFLGDSGCVCVE